MKRSLRLALGVSAPALLVAAAVLGAGPAFAKEVEFRGGGYIRNFTAACADVGYADPVYVNAIYRPRKQGTNGESTRLSFFFPSFYAASYELPRGRLGETFKKVVGGATGTATHFFTVKPRLRLTQMTPPRVRPATTALSMSGQIDNFDGRKGCRVDFALTLQLQP